MQPAVKCRGREYLRIIYGPEYTRRRTLPAAAAVARRKAIAGAIREFALGIEGLERFVRMSRSDESTNACSACWRSKVSRLIRDSSCPLMHLAGLFRISAPNWHIANFPVFRL